MAFCRPAGFSDEDSNSDDDYGYYSNRPNKSNIFFTLGDNIKKIEEKLQDAIKDGNIEEFSEIILKDLHNNVDARLESGWTPLLHCCFHAQENFVNLLLEKGADPNLHTDSVTPVMIACASTYGSEISLYNVVSSLIQHNCILNIGDKYGYTPLMRAVCNGRTSIVQLILDKDVNIDMRDRRGWTAVYSAIHNNQPEILKILLERGARLNVTDVNNRSPLDIAQSHDYPEILEILRGHLNIGDKNPFGQNEDDENRECHLTEWLDYYPGCKSDDRPTYSWEIDHLLHGMNCDSLQSIFRNKPIDLRRFLLLDDEDMIKLGIEMPFERQRLKSGLRNFHLRSWKVNAVAGLNAQRKQSYSVLEYLNVLGNHLQQLYILESTLTYTLRDYARIHSQLKFEPPDSPIILKLQEAATKMVANINNIRKEITITRKILAKINKESLKPVDLIREKSSLEVVQGYIIEIVILCSVGMLAYHTRGVFMTLLKK